jgi:hypothetical protein
MTKQTIHHPEAGVSIAGLLIAAALFSVVSLIGSRLVVDTNNADRTTDRLQSLENFKETIRSQLSCEMTLGVASWSLTPATCTSGVFTPKASNGRELSDPSRYWRITARCADNALVIDAKSTTPDPTIKKEVVKPDVFNGTSAFCRKFFVPQQSCPAGTKLKAIVDNGPLCRSGTERPAGFFMRKTNGSTAGQWCIISNEFSRTCACPTGSRVGNTITTSTFRQWQATVFCVWN